MARRKDIDIDMDVSPRELFLMLESLALSMDVLKGQGGYEALERDRDRLRAHNEAHDLFLKLEEQWDSLTNRDRKDGTSQPFDVRSLVSNPASRRRGGGFEVMALDPHPHVAAQAATREIAEEKASDLRHEHPGVRFKIRERK